MLLLGVCLTLCSLLTLSPASPVNSSSTSRNTGRCEYMKHYDKYKPGEYIPECDQNGNFLPLQCCTYTGYCWCVSIYTGDMVYNTKALIGDFHYECGKEYYCPLGWSMYGEKCIMVINHEKTWAEAESYCLFEGGNLASVHSDQENHFIQVLTKDENYDFPETWLGGYDAIQTCIWFWSDGTKFNYENWFMDYYVERKEHCLKMNYGPGKKWHFAACNETLPFVCSKSNWKMDIF
ncbi:galactose-specific lectin nattectin-like [Labrus mixtus]|uniref:galactose-specific lectin nattectin-like n=1 Tax=Labrus mixtus TaxID=508554 RepID=UPI0029C080F2|nr:galactose-specific lectin nattectin-like [Labrus mixtus]